jgi:thiol-disulfide isomerase/thioredoxin
MKTLLLSLALLTALALQQPALARASKSNIGKKITEIKADYIKTAPVTAGKPVMLEFWATWCGPCVASIPHINEIHKKFEPKGLVVIGLTQESNSEIRSFVRKNKMEYHVATDKGGKLNKELGVVGIPHSVLLSKTGEVVWEGHPGSLTDAVIEKAMQ